MDWIEIALEEYKTLRTESIEAVKSQYITLNLGAVIIGGIVITGFNLWEKTILSNLIFLIFIPLFCYFILTIWIGEVKRMTRVGIYIKKLENKISKEYPNNVLPLNFENWLRSANENGQTNQVKWNYIAVIALFFFISVSSIIIGNYKILDVIELKYIIGINVFESLVLGIVVVNIYLISRTLR